MPSYLANGGDGYSELEQERLSYVAGDLDTDVLKTYIQQKSPIEPPRKGRINVVCNNAAAASYPSLATFSVIIISYVTFGQDLS